MAEVFGQEQPTTAVSGYGVFEFVVQQLLQKMQTVTLVRVMSVSNDGGVSPVGTVSVRPLVNQMTGDRTPVFHDTIFNVPYFRLQGGANAVILDPQPGDIGMCAFGSRDLSGVKKDPAGAAANAAAGKGGANPGSLRQYDWADALYFGGLLNAVPTQYVRFHEGGIELKSTLVTVTGDLHVTGAINADGDVTGEGTSLHTHVHSGVQSGPSNTGPPV